MSSTGFLASLLDAGRAEAAALVCPDDGTTVTFGGLGARVDELAGALSSGGVSRGDRVTLALPNGPEIVELLLATALLGATVAPLNPAYTEDEFAFYLGDIEPRLILLPAGELAAARRAAGTTAIVDVTAAHDRVSLELGGRQLDPSPYETGQADDIAILLHTSGTTSRPKQVPLLQRNLMSSASSMARHYELSGDDVSYVAMPLFHIHGLVASTFAALHAGGAVVAPRRLAPRRFWGHLAAHAVTWVSAGPTVHHMLVERKEPVETRLRFTRSCSSALSPELMARCEEVYGVPMLEAYGMTEASHEMAANPLPPRERRPGTVGIPTGARIRILDPDWSDASPGTPGEVSISGPGVTPGYLGNEDANRESFRDGWFRTGDQGVFDGDYLRLVGRIKEIIIRGGENISPVEVEEALLAHPAVSDAACFGIPDEKYGEQVAVAVSLAGEADHASLVAHCRERLTAVKVPSVIHILDAIPRTPTGKLQRRRVAASIYDEP
jgi:acyl-CoA synthetase (AMP-forming)/AMP-acid ligase II